MVLKCLCYLQGFVSFCFCSFRFEPCPHARVHDIVGCSQFVSHQVFSPEEILHCIMEGKSHCLCIKLLNCTLLVKKEKNSPGSVVLRNAVVEG